VMELIIGDVDPNRNQNELPFFDAG
jgi:hypothetical protein